MPIRNTNFGGSSDQTLPSGYEWRLGVNQELELWKTDITPNLLITSAKDGGFASDGSLRTGTNVIEFSNSHRMTAAGQELFLQNLETGIFYSPAWSGINGNLNTVYEPTTPVWGDIVLGEEMHGSDAATAIPAQWSDTVTKNATYNSFSLISKEEYTGTVILEIKSGSGNMIFKAKKNVALTTSGASRFLKFNHSDDLLLFRVMVNDTLVFAVKKPNGTLLSVADSLGAPSKPYVIVDYRKFTDSVVIAADTSGKIPTKYLPGGIPTIAEVEKHRAEVAVNTAAVAADKAEVEKDKAEVEKDRAEVAVNTAVASSKASEAVNSASSALSDKNAAAASMAAAAKSAEDAKYNANQTFISGGLFAPASGSPYPPTSGVVRDTIWLVEFASHSTTFTYTSGDLNGITVTNGDMLFYDTPSNTFNHIPTNISGVLSVNGQTGSSVNLVAGDVGAIADNPLYNKPLLVKTANYADDVNLKDLSRAGFYRTNGESLDGKILPALMIHCPHTATLGGLPIYGAGIGFDYQGLKAYVTKFSTAGVYQGMDQIYTTSYKPTAADVGAYSKAESDSKFNFNYNLPSDTDLDTIIRSGFYRLANSVINGPSASVAWGQLQVIHGSSDTLTQIVTGHNSDAMYWRSGNPAEVGGIGRWYPWRKIYHEGDKPTAADVGAAPASLVNRVGELEEWPKSGSNANGWWVKHRDGTMECHQKIDLGQQVFTQAGGCALMSQKSWAFPEGFVSPPNVTVFGSDSSSAWQWGAHGAPTNTNVLYTLVTYGADPSIKVVVELNAFGRWK